MPTLKEAKEKVRTLSVRALEVAEDATTYKTFAEQKAALDPLEAEIKTWIAEVKDLEELEERKKAFRQNTGGSFDDAPAAERNAAVAKSFGAQFVESKGYKGLAERGFDGKWTSGGVEIKAPFFEGTDDAPGAGNAPVAIAPNVLPGIVGLPFAPLTIADLFPSGQTNSPLIRYLVETLAQNGADTVAEGDLKPESALEFDKVSETLHKIATFLPISDEMLEDWAQTRSYIDARLELFVKQAEEAQLLTGDGEDENLVGILNRPGLAPAVTKGSGVSAADDNSMDAIYRQITRIRVTQFLEPDAIAIDPLGWEKITLSKNSQGAYYANGPFVGQQPASLWGKKVATTPALAALTALVGAFAQGGQIFRKGTLTLEASNSHADYFRRNMTAIRAEERVGLAIYRPGAFGRVLGL